MIDQPESPSRPQRTEESVEAPSIAVDDDSPSTVANPDPLQLLAEFDPLPG